MIDHFESLLGERRSVTSLCGQDVIREDSGRHGPRRIQDQIGHLRTEDGGRAKRLADHRARRPGEFFVAQVVDLEARDVDEHERRVEIVQQPAPAFEIHADRLDPRGDRLVQRGERRGPDRPVGLEPVAQLERLQRRLDRGVEGGRVERLPRCEVSSGREPRAQRRNARIVRARLERRTRRDHGRFTASRELTLMRELGLQTSVEVVGRLLVLDALVELARIDALLHEDCRILEMDLAPEVPVRIEALRVDLAEHQVIEEANQRIALQQVVVDLRIHRRTGSLGGGARALQCREQVILRIEPIACAVADRAQEVRARGGARPDPQEAVPRIELRDESLRNDGGAEDAERRVVPDLFDLRAQELGLRARVLCLRDVREQQAQRELEQAQGAVGASGSRSHRSLEGSAAAPESALGGSTHARPRL